MSRIRLAAGGLLCAVLVGACSSGTSTAGGSLPRITSFTATPPVVAPGGSALLSWTATGAQAASLSPGIGPVTGTSYPVSPTTTTTYALTVSNAYGTDTAQAVVIVQPRARDRGAVRPRLRRVRADRVDPGGPGRAERDLAERREGARRGRRVVRGVRHPSTTLYDPALAVSLWTETGRMSTGRELHGATSLPSGNVLVSGGLTGSNFFWSTDLVEIYEVRSGTWIANGRMSVGRYGHAATLLGSGRVLFVGGRCSSVPPEVCEPDCPVSCPQGVLASAETFDPATDGWAEVAPMSQPRQAHRDAAPERKGARRRRRRPRQRRGVHALRVRRAAARACAEARVHPAASGRVLRGPPSGTAESRRDRA